MDEWRLIKISKYLSRHLRHQPERLGLTLGPGGWVRVDDVLAGCAAMQFMITRAELDEVVAKNDKQRFSFNEAGSHIRANQGYSVEVDLQLEPSEPPAVLYHGTAQSAVDAIFKQGLNKMRRHHVHLSLDVETATRVGSRHGKPVVLEVDAAAMARDGIVFYVSANGVWLTDRVEPRYLTRLA